MAKGQGARDSSQLSSKARASRGRPTSDTAETRARFAEGIRAGLSREGASGLAGISPASLYRYLDLDNQDHQAFREALDRAEADLEARAVKVVIDRIPSDPRLALAYLGRRFPERWGSGRRVPSEPSDQSSGEPESPSNVLDLDPENLENIAQRLLRDARDRRSGAGPSAADLRYLVQPGEPASTDSPRPTERDGADG